MPLGEIAGEILGGIVRFVGELFAQIVVEVLIKVPGNLICRLFGKRLDPDGGAVVLVGVLFWLLIAVVACAVYLQLAPPSP